MVLCCVFIKKKLKNNTMILQSIQNTIQTTFQQIRQCSISKILKTSAFVTFVALGAMYRFQGTRIKNCLSIDCPDINILDVHPKEKAAMEALFKTKHPYKSFFGLTDLRENQEYLRFNTNDPRDQVFIGISRSDHNGGLDPWQLAHILEEFDRYYDVRFQSIKNVEDICHGIEEGAKTGKIMKHAVIGAHGDYDLMAISESDIHETAIDFLGSFSSLDPSGSVFLLSCSTGKEGKSFSDHIVQKITGQPQKGNPFNNIAQKLSNIIKRKVFAPTHITTTFTTFKSKDKIFYHPKNLFTYDENNRRKSTNPLSLLWDENLYQVFRPQFLKCTPNINENRLTQYELLTEKVIRINLISRSLLHKDSPFMKDYFQSCNDDPRKIVLVFSGYENDGSLSPEYLTEVFSELADETDFSYRQLESPHDACYAIERASQQGEVSTVIFLGTKGSKGLLFSKDESGVERQMDISMDFKICFSGVAKDGKIIFIGGSLGKNGESESNIPQRVANTTQRVVEATTCPVFPNKIEIQSTSPVALYHPSHSFITKLSSGCEENNENLFKSFHPKTK